MRWTKKEREAIEEQIKEYERKIEDRRYVKLCIFCRSFNLIGHHCEDCPNAKINHILNICQRYEGQGECFVNDGYFIERFNLSIFTDKYFGLFIKNIQQLKFRKKMWEDSLSLNKKEFIRKYKGNK